MGQMKKSEMFNISESVRKTFDKFDGNVDVQSDVQEAITDVIFAYKVLDGDNPNQVKVLLSEIEYLAEAVGVKARPKRRLERPKGVFPIMPSEGLN